MSTAGEEKAAPSHASPMRYVVCWLALAVLTTLTFLLSHVSLGDWSLTIALLIAATKAAVVALFFMHLWDHKGVSRLVFLVSIMFVVILTVIVLADVWTRFPLALPQSR